MARTAVTVNALAPNTGTVLTTTAVDPTNGHSITGVRASELLIIVNNTAGSSKNVTIKAGTYPPALGSGLGDLVIAVAASATKHIRIEGGRFKQHPAAFNIDLESGITGTITAVKLNRGC